MITIFVPHSMNIPAHLIDMTGCQWQVKPCNCSSKVTEIVETDYPICDEWVFANKSRMRLLRPSLTNFDNLGVKRYTVWKSVNESINPTGWDKVYDGFDPSTAMKVFLKKGK
jgi:hypothetical protein